LSIKGKKSLKPGACREWGSLAQMAAKKCPEFDTRPIEEIGSGYHARETTVFSNHKYPSDIGVIR
jgi:hypothetical protein